MTAEAPDLDPGVLRTCSIGPKPEDAVLKAGLLAISEALGSDGLLEFPRRKNGTPVLMRQGFFERLLKGEASLQNCANADCSAAEADVKRLGLKQLLHIRCSHLDYVPNGHNQVAKASLLGLVDRCASAALAERLLEGQVLSDAHKAIVIRHAMLIYGARREQPVADGTTPQSGHGDGGKALDESEWWLLSVGGTRRYLHLPSCEVSGAPPSGPVYCYRSYTAPDPRDPKRKRSFRWQALLVKEVSKWTEDPLATEQKTQHKRSLTDAKDVKEACRPAAAVEPKTPVSPASAGEADEDLPAAPAPAGFSLFGDLDIEDLFDEFEADLDLPPASPDKSKASESAEIDDFFDSLLADSLFDEPKSGAGVSAAPRTGVAASEAAPDTAGGVGTEASASSIPSEIPAQPSSAGSSFEPPSRAAEEHERSADTQDETDEEEALPRDVAEAQLRDVLEKFYRQRQKDKLGNVGKIARKYSGDQVVELWSMLGTKYSLPPPEAVRWLSLTLCPSIAIQYPRGGEPTSASSALEPLRPPAVEGGAQVPADGWDTEAFPESALLAALQANDADAISVLAFRGCPSVAIRPRLWRALLGCSAADEEKGLKEHRDAYRELKTRALTEAADAAATATAESGAEATGAATTSDATMRTEVEADARSVWKGESFAARPEVVEAICNLVLTHARQRSYTRGSCDLAALLLFVMAQEGAASGAQLQEAEADAYWCFSALMAEVEDDIATDAGIANQARRIFRLLRVYDSLLAELVKAAGLGALPAIRLGSGLCTRAGFSLHECARLWDSMLADPRRFEFCDFTVVALLLLSRGDLLQRDDVGGLAETLLAAPRKIEAPALLRCTYAICAFERRCPAGSRGEFPPRPSAGSAGDSFDIGSAKGIDLDHVVSAAQSKATEAASSISSLWGKAWQAGRSAAASAGEMLTEERMQKVKELGASTAQAVASAATAAGTSAASAAAAAQAAAAAHLEDLDKSMQVPAEEPKLQAVGLPSDVWQEEAEDAQEEALTAAPVASEAPATHASTEEEVPQLMEAPQLVEAPVRIVEAPVLVDGIEVP